MIQTHLDNNGKTVRVTARSDLRAEDYERLTPELERLIAEHGKLNLLFDMSNVDDIEPGAVWRDVKFDTQHLTDFERVTIVGDAGWEKTLTELGTPFTSAEVEYFKVDEKDAAEAWLAKS